jgi:glycosyltransferase involved in cell wall biosynthesis
MNVSLDIVVPVRNEESSLAAFYERMTDLGYTEHLIFVDNASTDRTRQIIDGFPVGRLIVHEVDEGYGASVRDGIVASGADFVVILDADLEYPPEAIPEVLEALRHHSVVYCSRFLGGRPEMPLLRRFGNRLATGLYNLLFRQRITDFYTGMKGLRREALPFSTLRKQGFEHGAELGAMISLAGEKIHEVPVQYTPRARGRSKMRHLPDGLKMTFYIFLYWVRCMILGRPLNPDVEASASRTPGKSGDRLARAQSDSQPVSNRENTPR